MSSNWEKCAEDARRRQESPDTDMDESDSAESRMVPTADLAGEESDAAESSLE
jgi:hypothetical protein